MNKREEQKEERRNKILEVSLNLFVEKGFAGTKISDISAAANMSAGLFFHYSFKGACCEIHSPSSVSSFSSSSPSSSQGGPSSSPS